MAVYFYKGAIGHYGLREIDGALTNLWFNCRNLDDLMGMSIDSGEVVETPLLREAKKQLDAYFAGKLKAFSLPMAPVGTPFRQLVWGQLSLIPYGETRTYGEIAALVGNPKASRAVGMANNHNPLPVFIPCHRVIGANGTLTGYAGGLDIKSKLLCLEKGQD